MSLPVNLDGRSPSRAARSVRRTPTDLTTFGVEAQHIVSIKLGAVTVPLTSGASNDLRGVRRPLSATLMLAGDFDFHAFEVA